MKESKTFPVLNTTTSPKIFNVDKGRTLFIGIGDYTGYLIGI